MKPSRLPGFLIALFGCLLYVWMGFALLPHSGVRMVDLRGIYYGADCLLHHQDPYHEPAFQQFLATQPAAASLSSFDLRVITLFVNLPTIFPFLAPFALLSWPVASLVWMVTIALLYSLAALAMWQLASHQMPTTAGILVAVFLCGSELLIEVGNAAGLAISLALLGLWCLLRGGRLRTGRLGSGLCSLSWLGVALLAAGLLIKPHTVGFLWLPLVLWPGLNRRQGWRTLGLCVAVALASIAWVSSVAPHWPEELRQNLHTIAAPGGLNDTSPAIVTQRSHGASVVHLDPLLRVLDDNPGHAALISLAYAALMLAWWFALAIRRRHLPDQMILAMATLGLIVMLALYHRQHDTRVLILLVPACAAISHRALRRVAVVATLVVALGTADLVTQTLGIVEWRLHPALTFVGHLVTIALARTAPLAMLVASVALMLAWQRSPATSAEALPLGSQPQAAPQ